MRRNWNSCTLVMGRSNSAATMGNSPKFSQEKKKELDEQAIPLLVIYPMELKSES